MQNESRTDACSFSGSQLDPGGVLRRPVLRAWEVLPQRVLRRSELGGQRCDGDEAQPRGGGAARVRACAAGLGSGGEFAIAIHFFPFRLLYGHDADRLLPQVHPNMKDRMFYI